MNQKPQQMIKIVELHVRVRILIVSQLVSRLNAPYVYHYFSGHKRRKTITVAMFAWYTHTNPPALDRGLTGGSQERWILILAQQGGSLATKLK